jgi:hypothetical protein
MQTLDRPLESYDLVGDPEIRRAAARTLKGFCATYLAHHFPQTPSDFFDEMATALHDQHRRTPTTRQGHDTRPGRSFQDLPRGAEGREFVAYVFLAKLLSQTRHLEKANALWGRFFAKLGTTPEYAFSVAGAR